MRRTSPVLPVRATRVVTALTAAAALALAGCGQDASSADDSDEAAASSSSTPTSESPSPSATEPSASTEPSTGPSTELSSKPTKKPSRTAEPTPAGLVIDVTVQGDQVSPQAEVVEADIDKPITLQIQSDRAGEMHVHSSPEQYVDFGPGSTTAEITFENPGAIDVEEHETGALVLKLLVQ